MMPVYLHRGWLMGTSCMACGVLTMWHNCVRPLVHIWPLPQICYGHGCRRWPERRVQTGCSSRSKL